MKFLIVMLLLAVSLDVLAQEGSSSSIYIQRTTPPRSATPPRMSEPEVDARLYHRQRILLCNQQATSKNLKGREHRAFVSHCLSGDSSVGGSRQPAPSASARH